MTEKERCGEKLFRRALGKNDAWNASQGEGPSRMEKNGGIESEEYFYSSSLSSSDESDSSSLLSLCSTEATGSGE